MPKNESMVLLTQGWQSLTAKAKAQAGIDKAKAAIDKVATSLGYEYVLDSSQGGSVIIAKGKNIMAEVKKELGF